MAYPIRFKITGKNGLKLAKDEVPLLFPNGNLAVANTEHFYTTHTFQSCANFELWVALEKVDGKWDYKKIGY